MHQLLRYATGLHVEIGFLPETLPIEPLKLLRRYDFRSEHTRGYLSEIGFRISGRSGILRFYSLHPVCPALKAQAKIMRIVSGEWIKSKETSRMISSRHRGNYSLAVQSWPQKLRYLPTQRKSTLLATSGADQISRYDSKIATILAPYLSTTRRFLEITGCALMPRIQMPRLREYSTNR